MKIRFDQFDILRGMFFIPMFIFHIYSFYDLTNNWNTSLAKNPFIHFLGYVRDLYIILAGFSVYLSWRNNKNKNKKEFLINRYERSINILKYAIVITILSHFLYPDKGIKFGILHFIALSTLIISPLAMIDLPIITIIVLLISIYGMNLIPSINPLIDTITGASIHYSTADWFPLNKKLYLIIIGLLFGQIITQHIKPYQTNNKILNIFKFMGTNSLELYTSHFIIIMITYWILKNKINI